MNSRQIALITVIIIIIAAITLLQVQKTAQKSSDEKRLIANLDQSARVEAKQKAHPIAPELQGITGYLNIPNNQETITLQEHIGKKVILIDFWTYTCINCQRTFPYLKEWWRKYKDQGLLIIGVHAPEFEFEKKRENVENAIKEFQLEYPVVQDNNFQTWNAYNNRYWPAKYLVDIDGFIVYRHFGEGKYEETEKKIQELLEERAQVLQEKMEMQKETSSPEVDTPDFEKIRTPEIYFGYQFAYGRNLIGNKEGFSPDHEVTYALPPQEERKENHAYLEGTWYNDKDYMELRSNEGKITLKFEAKKVNIVAGSEDLTTITIVAKENETRILLTIQDHTLYNILSLEEYSKHDLEIEAKKGFRIYTFTFG